MKPMFLGFLEYKTEEKDIEKDLWKCNKEKKTRKQTEMKSLKCFSFKI
jgi:hypothetical protein